jgi:hypothetical protein
LKEPDLNDLLREGRLPSDFFEGEPMSAALPPPRRGDSWGHAPAEPHPDLADAEGGAALPSFPVAALPPAIGAFVAAVATFTQTPVDMPAVLALGVCSAAVAGKARVLVKGNYSEPLNLFTIVAMPPASRKSSVFRTMFGPFKKHEEWLRKATHARRHVVRAERRALEDEAKALRVKLPRAKGSERADLEALIAANAQRLEGLEPSEDPCLYLQDVTSEQLAKVLEEQGGRVCIADAEGTFFENVLGRYSDDPNIDNVLKSHEGDAIRVNRVGRPVINIDRPAVTMVMAVQPDVIRSAANKSGVRDRGFLGRLLMAMPPSLIGRRDADPPEVPKHLWAGYSEAVRKLLGLAAPREDWPVALSAGARDVWHEFWAQNEEELAPGGALEHMSDWGGKLPGAVARVAGVLHFAGAACLGDEALREAWNAPVSEATMACAVECGHYFGGHARAVYDGLLVSREERALRDRHASALVTLRWFYGDREFTTADPLEAFWPASVKAPPPPGMLYAREALAAFAGGRGDTRPNKESLALALRGAVGKPGAGLALEQRAKTRTGQRRWAIVPVGGAAR